MFNKARFNHTRFNVGEPMSKLVLEALASDDPRLSEAVTINVQGRIDHYFHVLQAEGATAKSPRKRLDIAGAISVLFTIASFLLDHGDKMAPALAAVRDGAIALLKELLQLLE